MEKKIGSFSTHKKKGKLNKAFKKHPQKEAHKSHKQADRASGPMWATREPALSGSIKFTQNKTTWKWKIRSNKNQAHKFNTPNQHKDPKLSKLKWVNNGDRDSTGIEPPRSPGIWLSKDQSTRATWSTRAAGWRPRTRGASASSFALTLTPSSPLFLLGKGSSAPIVLLSRPTPCPLSHCASASFIYTPLAFPPGLAVSSSFTNMPPIDIRHICSCIYQIRIKSVSLIFNFVTIFFHFSLQKVKRGNFYEEIKY
jgi:hypothetical protein